MILIIAVTENEKMKDCNTCRKFKKHAWCVKCEYEPKDLVDVVRCKECKWFNQSGCAIYIVDDTDKPTENDFCSYGERADT